MHEFLVTLAFSSSRHDGTHRQTPENARVPGPLNLSVTACLYLWDARSRPQLI